MKKIFLSIFVILSMVLTLISGMSLTASAANSIQYSYYTVDGTTANKSIYGFCSNYTVVNSTTTNWTSGWYVVNGNVTISSVITAKQWVNLILCDGATLTAEKGIRICGDASDGYPTNELNIYAQTQGTGKLIATGSDSAGAGIGGGYFDGRTIKNRCGDINIHGGIITATGAKFGGSGIGSGGEGDARDGGGCVTIFDGNITAIGKDGGAGIGSFVDCGLGSVTIYGGNVNALGGEDGSGICAESITINGGNVIARGEEFSFGIGSGIGSGRESDSINVTINGGNLTAIGGSHGKGISGERCSHGGTLNINGGTVSAFGRTQAIDLTVNFSDKIKTGIYAGDNPENAQNTSPMEFNRVRSEKAFVTTLPPVDYIKCDWNESTQTVDKSIKRDIYYSVVTKDTTAFEDNSWYVVNANTVINEIVFVNGTANLILCDGATLTVEDCVRLVDGNTLNIYSQANGTGKLVVNSREYGAAGIGSRSTDSSKVIGSGNLNVHGGEISATGACYGAGIGGGNLGNGGNVTIYGGKVVAAGNGDAAGIGGGIAGYEGEIKGNGGIVTIYDGEVIAITNGGAGIGGGNSSMRGKGGKGATVSIYGGKVIAAGGAGAVAIGGGKNSADNGSLTISKGMLIMGGPNEDNLTEISNVTNEKYVVISKSSEGHSWQDATCTTPKTCSVCGLTEGTAPGHTWIDATCTKPKTCSICGATDGEPLGHTWQDATCTTPKTCSICGATDGEPLSHTWQDATCTKPKTCSICGATDGEPLGHTWQDATCTTPKTCSVCHMTEGKALGHYYVATTMISEATCTQCALYIMECTRCDAYLDSQPVGKPKSHTWIDATCTEPKKCSVCGTKATLSYPLGHEYRPIKKVSDEPLTYSAKCIRCDELTDNYLITDESFDYTDTTTYKSVGKGETLKAGTKLQATSGFGDGELTVYIDGKLAAVVNGGETWAAPYCIKCVDYDTKIIPVRLTMWFETACNYTFANCEDSETCVYCGHMVGAPLGHTFENGVCTECGFAQFKFNSASLVLSGELVMDINCTVGDIEAVKGGYMEMTVGSTSTQKVYLSDATHNADGTYSFPCYLNVLQMADDITLSFHYGDIVIGPHTTSVAKYLNNIIEKYPKDTKLIALAQAIADYGHFSQPALQAVHGFTLGEDGKYQTMNRISTGDFVLPNAADLASYAATKEGNIASVTKLSKALALDHGTDLMLNFKCAGEIPQIVVTDKDGNEVEFDVTEKNGKQIVTIPQISAHKLGDFYTVSFNDGAMKLQVSALSYTYSILSSASASAAQKEAVAALYYYYQAAIAYQAAN